MKMRPKKFGIFSEFQISNITINASPQKYWHFVRVMSHLGFHFNRRKHRESPQCPSGHLSFPSPCFSLPSSEESNLFPISGFDLFPSPFQSSACWCHPSDTSEATGSPPDPAPLLSMAESSPDLSVECQLWFPPSVPSIVYTPKLLASPSSGAIAWNRIPHQALHTVSWLWWRAHSLTRCQTGKGKRMRSERSGR